MDSDKYSYRFGGLVCRQGSIGRQNNYLLLGKTEKRDAEIVAVRTYSFIRFRWMDDENEREFFELKMTNNELTNDFVLEITDFADTAEVGDLRELWESQVDTLRRTCGF